MKLVKSKIEQYLIKQIRYYKKSIKNQPKNQDERFINYLCGKKHAYESALLVLREQNE